MCPAIPFARVVLPLPEPPASISLFSFSIVIKQWSDKYPLASLRQTAL